MGMSTMNNKMTTSNRKGVEKRDAWKGMLETPKVLGWTWKFSFWRIGGTINVEGYTWGCGH